VTETTECVTDFGRDEALKIRQNMLAAVDIIERCYMPDRVRTAQARQIVSRIERIGRLDEVLQVMQE
jgi:hypothetical protein